MFNPSYLVLSRHNVFYLRFPIPVELHPSRLRTDIKLSLDTRQRSEALHIARSLVYLAEAAFQHPSIRAMNYEQIRELLQERFKVYGEKPVKGT